MQERAVTRLLACDPAEVYYNCARHIAWVWELLIHLLASTKESSYEQTLPWSLAWPCRR